MNCRGRLDPLAVRRMARRPLQRVTGFLVAEMPVCCRTPTRRASADNLQAVAVGPDRPVLLSLRRSSLRGVPQGDPPVRRRDRPWPFGLRAALKIAYGRTGGDRRRG